MEIEFVSQLQMEKAFIASCGISWQEEWSEQIASKTFASCCCCSHLHFCTPQLTNQCSCGISWEESKREEGRKVRYCCQMHLFTILHPLVSLCHATTYRAVGFLGSS